MSSSSSSSSGIGFLGLLAVAFIVLKITGFIPWSWWWVLAPIWGGVAFWILMVVGILLISYIQIRKKTRRFSKKSRK